MTDATIRRAERSGADPLAQRLRAGLLSRRAVGLLRLAAALGHEEAGDLVTPARCGTEWRDRLVYALPEREQRLLACDCAERALNRERVAGREPDERSWRAIEVARLYARGEASREDLDAARAAAEDAAEAAAAAAWAAAWAAWDAARAAAWAAAWAAARAADAAEDAAWAAERRDQVRDIARHAFAGAAERREQVRDIARHAFDAARRLG